MDVAAPLFALAAVLVGFGLVIRVGVGSWIRLKQFERDARPPLAAPGLDVGDLAARLARIEQVVEATAVEVERLGEGQRYTARLLAEPRGAAPAAAQEPARVITPH
jgi:hypothetical protein